MPDQEGFLAPAEVPTAYASVVRLATSIFDFRLYFGEVIPPQMTVGSGEQTQTTGKIADRICIVVPPETAKALSQILLKSIAEFESKTRPILNATVALDQKQLPK